VGDVTTLSCNNYFWQKIMKDRHDIEFFKINDDNYFSNAVIKATIELDDAEN
jgi:hypothetical protein